MVTQAKTYPTVRKAAVRLNDEQKYAVAIYCIEHKGVIQDRETNEFTIFRVNPSQLAKEINEDVTTRGYQITGYHVTDSVKFYNLINKLTQTLPEIPLTNSVQEDILTAEVERLKNELKKSQDELLKAAGIINNYKERFVQIRKLATS